MNHITCVCLNPCLDKTVELETLRVGGLNRIRASRVDAAGKGLNVARNLAALGFAATCLGFAGEENAPLLEIAAESSGVLSHWVRVPGAVRTNLKALDLRAGVITEINEPGPPVPEALLETLERNLAEQCGRSDWVVFTGSLPVGMPAGTYARLTRLARRAAPRCKVALDAEGAAFAEAVQEKPDLVKPNRYELELFLGKPCGDPDTLKAGVRRLARLLQGRSGDGALVCVSMGADGALLADGDELFHAPAPDVPVRSTAGAGDAMLAGLIAGCLKGLSAREAFRLAVAMAGAKVQTSGTQPVQRVQADALLPLVNVASV